LVEPKNALVEANRRLLAWTAVALNVFHRLTLRSARLREKR